jgi:pre-60S factor REI1
MLGKGHCKIDLEDEENRFWEFYEFELEGDDEEVKPVRDEEDELRLPSGKILGHRALRVRRKCKPRDRSESPREQLLLAEGEEEEVLTPPESRDQRVIVRKGTEMSMIGVPELRQRALVAVEKKIEGIERSARNEYQAGVERGGNSQKTFRVTGIGKKRGGLEKRNG